MNSNNEELKIKNVVVAGGGILGSQIAYQTAYCGFDVTILIRKEDSLEEVNKKLQKLHKTYLETIDIMDTKAGKNNWANGIASVDNFNKNECIKKAENALKNIKIETDQREALKNADLLVESITENINIKKSFYEGISNLMPDKTIVVTNSSTLLPSKLANYTGREEKYLALHFANSIWKNNISEVMKHSNTDDKYFYEIVNFAKHINMIPLEVREEKSGYLLNSLLVPFLLCAMDLLANGTSDVETIDKSWTLGTGAPKGPFQIIDVVGLETAKNIVTQYQKVPDLLDPLFKKMMLPYNYDGMLKILNEYIEAGKLGKSVGEGFYKYNDNE